MRLGRILTEEALKFIQSRRYGKPRETYLETARLPSEVRTLDLRNTKEEY